MAGENTILQNIGIVFPLTVYVYIYNTYTASRNLMSLYLDELIKLTQAYFCFHNEYIFAKS
jgi:hypothetical protein